MADLSWLRLGQRARTPIVPKSPTTSEHARAHEPDEHRRIMPSRVSSYLSLNSGFSFSPEPPMPTGNPDLVVKDKDKVWHNPSLDQMVEALQVIMMTKGVFNPIPVGYNSYVLHLIEGFTDTQERLQAANIAYEEAKKSHSQTSDDFRTVADEWERREAQYKAEIKRLEALLAPTSRDGLETMTLARTSSMIDRSGTDTKQFASGLKKLHSQPRGQESSHIDTHAEYVALFGQTPPTDANFMKALERIEHTDHSSIDNSTRRSSGPLPNILNKDKDFLASEGFRRRDAAAAASTNASSHPRPRVHRQAGIYTQGDAKDLLSATDAELLPNDRTIIHFAGHDQLTSDSTSSSSDSDGECGIVMAGNTTTTRRASHGLRPQPLSGSTGSGYPSNDSNDSEPRVRRKSRSAREHQLGPSGMLPCKGVRSHVPHKGRFSFVAGDDNVPVIPNQEVRYGDSRPGERRFAPDKLTSRRDEQLPHCILDDTLDSSKAPARYPSVSPRYAAGAMGLASPLKVRESHRQQSRDKTALYRSGGSAVTIGTVIHDGEEGSPYLRGLGSTGSKTTAIRNGSIRSNQSYSSFAEGQAERVSPSPNQHAQRQTSAQIAASRAVQRNQRRESGSKV